MTANFNGVRINLVHYYNKLVKIIKTGKKHDGEITINYENIKDILYNLRYIITAIERIR